jgi:carbamoyl-phosphate synthase large subunit
MQRFSVLVSSAGRRGALVGILRRSLARVGVQGVIVAADQTRLAAAMHLADQRVVVPRHDDSGFCEAVLDACRAHAVRLVVPTHDGELAVYAAARERFAAAGVTIAVSSPAVVEIGADKTRTNSWLRDHGFPAPRQASVSAVLADAGSWAWPVVAKPRRGSAGIGVTRIPDAATLRRVDADSVVVEESAAGVEHTIDVLVDATGACRCAVPRRRLEVRAGEVAKAVTVRDEAMISLATRIAETLPGAYGVLNIQVFQDADTLRVIELNARFGGGFPLAYAAGAYYPDWLVEEIIGAPSTITTGWHAGLVMLRYDDAVFVSDADAGLA